MRRTDKLVTMAGHPVFVWECEKCKYHSLTEDMDICPKCGYEREDDE